MLRQPWKRYAVFLGTISLLACGSGVPEGAGGANSPGTNPPPSPVIDAGTPPIVHEDAGVMCAIGSAQTGTKSCRNVLMGAQGCQSLATLDAQCRCTNEKLGEATAAAKPYALAVFRCAEQSGCGTSINCILGRCGREIVACQSR